MSNLFIFIAIWLLSGVVALCLDVIVSGKPKHVSEVFWMFLLGFIGLVMFVCYLIWVTAREFWQESNKNIKNNIIALGSFTIIATLATGIYFLFEYINR